MLEFFREYGLSENAAAIVGAAVRMFGVLLLSIVAHYIARRFILRAFHNVIRRTKTDWDDVLLKNKVLNHVAHLVPAIIIYVMAPVALAGFEQAADTIRSLTQIYMIVVLLLTLTPCYRPASTSTENSVSRVRYRSGDFFRSSRLSFFLSVAFTLFPPPWASHRYSCSAAWAR